MPASDKAAVLIQALPYLQRFRGATFVIKYGGSAMDDETLVAQVLRDVVMLEIVGINPVIVHGGGKAITRAMKESGMAAQFIDGMRVTDEASITIIDRTLTEEISPAIAAKIVELGGRAQPVAGKEVLRAEKINYHRESDGEAVDLGFVGDITEVALASIELCILKEIVPVISPVARGAKGELYNINADLAAAEVAKALKAQKLIYLSDVNGVLRDPQDATSRIPLLTRAEIETLKATRVIDGGMLPKVASAIEALEAGVGQVHFLDGRIAHSLLVEIFTDEGVGTEIKL
jgi:acetylglutamate kinase